MKVIANWRESTRHGMWVTDITVRRPKVFKQGESVCHVHTQMAGTIVAVKNSNAVVQFGNLTATCKFKDLRRVKGVLQ